MKKSVFPFSAFLLLLLPFTACKKEKSFEDRLVGHWHSLSVKNGDQDVTNLFDFEVNLDANREYDLTVKSLNLLTGKQETSTSFGNWTADEAKQDAQLTDDKTKETVTYEVKDLTDTEMTVETVLSTTRVEIKFSKQ